MRNQATLKHDGFPVSVTTAECTRTATGEDGVDLSKKLSPVCFYMGAILCLMLSYIQPFCVIFHLSEKEMSEKLALEFVETHS